MDPENRFWSRQVAGPLIFGFLLLLTCLVQAQPVTTRAALENVLASRRLAQPSDAAPDMLYEFYAARDFRPAWSGSRTAEDNAAFVHDVLTHAEEQGLRSRDYDEAARQWPSPPQDSVEAAAYELSLTADLLRYARDVRLGRTSPRQVYGDVALPPRVFDAGAALNQALRAGAIEIFLDGLPPQQPEYRALVRALARYRAAAAQGGWTAVPAKGVQRPALLRRLAAEDETLAAAVPDDDELRSALLRFQRRNGLAPDGKLGTATLAALNLPVAARINQLVANMERWRWLPRQFEARTVLVNVPDQTVEYRRGAEVLFASRVAVGRLTSPTPIVRMTALQLVANPPWHVPDDIADAQILPRLQREPNYLASRNMVLVDGPAGDPHGKTINWRKLKTMPYAVDQNPGQDSAMGVLMLDSPNDFGVYLHDTPGKDVFLPAMRQKSNGCIRVEDMLALSSLLLTGDAEEGLPRLQESIAGGETESLALAEPVPVYLLYWTAVADGDGGVGFRADFYGRDRKLLAALAAPRRL